MVSVRNQLLNQCTQDQQSLSSDPTSSRRVFMNSCSTPVLNATHPSTHYINPLPKGQTGAKAFGSRQWQSSVSAFSSFPFPSCSPHAPSPSNTHTHKLTHWGSTDANAGIIHTSHVTSPQNGQSEPSPRPQHAASFSKREQVQERGNQMIWARLRGSEASI